MTTRLEPQPIIEQVNRLIHENQRSFGLSLESKLDSSIVGHQYLFILIPFGRIETPQIVEHVINESVTKLALKGYSPILHDQKSNIKRSYPSMHITIEELSLTAYDLIFMRKMVCRISLSAQIISADKIILRSEKVIGYQSRYVAFAFEPELSNILRISVEESIKSLFDKIGV